MKRKAKVKKKSVSAHQCDSCKAMVFIGQDIHEIICREYRNNPKLVEGSHKAYGDIISKGELPS